MARSSQWVMGHHSKQTSGHVSLIVLVCIPLLLALTSSCHAVIAHVQTVGAATAGTANTISTGAFTVTAGNTLIVSTSTYYPETWAVTSNNANCATFTNTVGPLPAWASGAQAR